MKLLSNWREVLTGAWSVKLMGFAAFMQVASELVPYMSGIMPWWVSVLVILAAMVARHLQQPELTPVDPVATEPEVIANGG